MKRALVLLIVLGVVAGCGQQDSQPEPRAAGGEQTRQPAEASGGYKIAVIPKGLAHQFWRTVNAGAEAAAKETGAAIVWNGPAKETEIDKQISIIEDALNSGVNALVMAACHDQALIAVVKKAMDRGIPVITIDSGVASDLPLSFVATDNVAGGKHAADFLAKAIGEEGEVGLIPFKRGASSSDQREQGFREGIAAYPNIKLVSVLYCESDAGKAMEVTQDMMTANPNLKGIFAANEPAVVGTVQALKAAGKAGQIALVGFDAAEAEIAALKEGAIQALIVQNPYRMGYEGVKAAIAAIEGKPVEKRVDTGVTIVTMENFNDPEVQKLLYPGA